MWALNIMLNVLWIPFLHKLSLGQSQNIWKWFASTYDLYFCISPGVSFKVSYNNIIIIIFYQQYSLSTFTPRLLRKPNSCIFSPPFFNIQGILILSTKESMCFFLVMYCILNFVLLITIFFPVCCIMPVRSTLWFMSVKNATQIHFTYLLTFRFSTFSTALCHMRSIMWQNVQQQSSKMNLNAHVLSI